MPNLAVDALRKRIADGKLAPVHVFVGEDAVLIGRLVEAVEATVDEADRPFAVERIHAAESGGGGSPVDIAAAARGLPMLGDRRIVFVLRAERLLKPKRAGKATEAAADDEGAAGEEYPQEAIDMGPLEDYLENPVPSTVLVFVAAGIDRTRRFSKRLLAKAQVTTFGGISAERPAERREANATAVAWVQEELTRAGRTIEPAAVRLIVERAGGDISRLRDDIERVALFTEGRPRISRDDALEIVSTDIPVEDDWAVTNAMAAGDLRRALLEAGRRFDRGDSPHMLVGQLRWWVSARLAQAEPGRVRDAFDALLRTDLALKSSGGDHRVLVERLIVELTGRPLPQRDGGWRQRA